MASQRQLQVSQRSFLRTQQIDEAGKTETVGLIDISTAVSGLRTEITQRLSDLDVHLMRLDGVAAAMDVGSGTVTGEISRIIKKIQQKIEDFKTACGLAGKYVPGAIAQHAGQVGEALLNGLIEFAKDAAKILAISTAVGATLRTW